MDTSHPAFGAVKAEVEQRVSKMVNIHGKRTVDSIHRELGKMMWENCGMARSEAGLRSNLAKILQLRHEFWNNVNIIGTDEEFNQSLEKAGRVADFLELGGLMCLDAMQRAESCCGQLRLERPNPD